LFDVLKLVEILYRLGKFQHVKKLLYEKIG
jgi:hypothetical protein